MTEQPTNERRGLPSASAMPRIADCPGSLDICRSIPDRPTDDSDFGNKIHDYLAGKIPMEDLTFEQLDRAEECQKIEAKVLAQWRLRNQIPDDAAVIVTRDSERLWHYHDGQRAYSGVADVTYQWTDRALVLDYKTLPGDHAEASENLQLRTLACLVDRKFGYKMAVIEVAIIQPLVTHSPEVCSYDAEAMKAAHAEIGAILRAANAPDAPRRVGPQCRFCRANDGTCPEARGEVVAVSKFTLQPEPGALSIANTDLLALYDRIGPVMKMVESIKAELKHRVATDPETWRQLGVELVEGNGKRKVSDITTLGTRVNALGVSWEEITAACNITMKALKPLVRKATQLKGMGLDNKVDELLEGCVTTSTGKPKLKRIGGYIEDEEAADE
jgi:hypothetical protein